MWLQGKLYAIVCQDSMHLVGQPCQHEPQKVDRYHSLSLGVQFREGHFAGAVNSYEEVLPTLFRRHLGKIDVQVADGIVLDFFSLAQPARPRSAAGDLLRDAGNSGANTLGLYT